MDLKSYDIAIVDYGLGNLFSVKHACEYVGAHAWITSDRRQILDADGVILPGVGAFGDAMESLRQLGLVSVLKDIAAADKPLIGICLGLQLLMEESHEFGLHKGLGIIKGDVVPFDSPHENGHKLKVPQIGWNRIISNQSWEETPLEGLREGDFMYFVHSYVVRPLDPKIILSKTEYGHIEFCSSIARGNLFGYQFHPERSGESGLRIYSNMLKMIKHVFDK